ncbi:tRNA-dihydrouridine(16/17) synthase [NAD(P)(+)]-like protein [Rhizoclosmatium hyalinum]|nr:tRNA-dihydrouridine(16/17) synthase [NAD(P)(+)]-like protein [Rhizoclosmatium hyalinum]
MIIAEKYLSDPEYREQVFDPARGDGDPSIDRPLVVQIAGNDKHLLLQCAQSLEPYCDAIDFNMGCPQQRAVDGGYGSSLLPVSQWPLVAEIVSHLSQNLKVPVWCKLRLVAGNKSLTHKLAALLADNGCKLVTLHARYASVTRRRQGLADLNEVKILKEMVTSIPILSNGNVRTLEDVTKNLELTGADGIMVGEALLANPWLFEGKEADSVGIIREYLDICTKVHVDAFSIPSARQHVRNFLRSNSTMKPKPPNRILAHSKFTRKMAFPKLPTLNELKAAKPITPDELSTVRELPVEPTWYNGPASKTIKRYLVIIPGYLVFAFVITLVLNNARGITVFNPLSVFSLIDIIVVIGFNILGYRAVEQLVPEWMVLFIYYYIIWGIVKVVWVIVYYVVFFDSTLPASLQGSTHVDQLKITGITTGVVIPIIYIYWIINRAYLPFREYALEIRKAVEAAKLSESSV